MASDEGAPAGSEGFGPQGGVGPYRVLDTAKRASAGHTYVVIGLLCGVLAWGIGEPLLWLTGVFPLAALATIQYMGAWRMSVTDMQAINIASSAASFDFGHGSATLGYRGWLAKPVWQVLLYSDTPTPDREALVTIDAMTGAVTGSFEQPVETL